MNRYLFLRSPLFFLFSLLLTAVVRLGAEIDNPMNQQFPLAQSSFQRGDKKICLTMIVRNESKIIERCLDRVKEIVDCVSICDTGSTDDTASIIESYLAKHCIPGKVHHHKWENFGYNRTASALSAQKTLQEYGIPLDQSYLLFLDADMLLIVDPLFSKRQLEEDAYHLIQKSDTLSYYNLRLAKASLPWQCVGVTHEYWTSPLLHREGVLKTLIIDDQGDGGCKADKFERDIKLLTQGLKDEPENQRYMFYLAQSYKCLEKYDDAIFWYQVRINKGGWKEEIYYSMAQIGECFEEKGDWNNALKWYLKAYEFNPVRAETLHLVAKHYRMIGECHLAYLFAKQGQQIPFPHEQILFVTYPVYDYQFDEEISIAAYYTPFREDGFCSLNKLLLNKKVPEYVKMGAYSNLQFYVTPLKNCVFKRIDLKLPLLKKGGLETFKPLNPTIVKSKNGYDVICRTVNFIQKGGNKYTPLETDDPFKGCITRNFLIHYDQNYHVDSQAEIIENLDRVREDSYLSQQVKGLEDARLFRLKDQLWFTCTTYDTNPYERQISLCKIAEKGNEAKVSILTPLIGPDPHRCEKNWLPFVKNEEPQFIYSYDPFKIVKANLATGQLETVVEYEPTHDFSNFRGSAGPIEFEDGYLIMTHEVIFEKQRYYVHRFLFLDHNFQVKKISKPFTFKHLGIEYVCGMILNHEGSQLIISLGVEDSEAYLAFVNSSQVRELLEPLPANH